jgi:hypothetical protein
MEEEEPSAPSSPLLDNKEVTLEIKFRLKTLTRQSPKDSTTAWNNSSFASAQSCKSLLPPSQITLYKIKNSKNFRISCYSLTVTQ